MRQYSNPYPHTSSGHQFKNQLISNFDRSENDLVNGLFFELISHLYFDYIHLTEYHKVAHFPHISRG